jgi:hypothetical protein
MIFTLVRKPPKSNDGFHIIFSFGMNEFGIVVASPLHDRFVVKTGTNESIGALKTKIHVKCGIAPAEQLLHFSGKSLSDDSRLVGSYGIRHLSSINLLVRIRGDGLTIS